MAFGLHIVGIYRPILIFVESFCRVEELSLTGKILYQIVDRFIVQWPGLSEKHSRAEYLGKIC
jgi:beta-1,4-N-acetylglucosaminyltransferase